MNTELAHLEYIQGAKKLTRLIDSYGKPTVAYRFLEQVCNSYGLEVSEQTAKEMHWRLYNNDFAPRVCVYCKINFTKFVPNSPNKVRRYCSTSCSAKDRDNESRGGIANSEGWKKSRQTIFDKYGVYHQSQIPAVLDSQQSKRYKTYEIKSPAGFLYKVQGYERYVIPQLWDIYGEANVIVAKKDVPKIKYNNTHLYFPDAYIPSENTLVEVKSTFTIKCPKLKHKMEAAMDIGYRITVALWDKGNISYLKYEDLYE